jgi:lysophospholipase L1-like esterase
MSECRDIRICFVGDSFVNGTGDEEKLGWSGRLCAQTNELEITYYNLGIRRNTSEDVKERWERECGYRLTEGSENLVVFSFGVNDTVIENNELRVSQQRSVENARTILVEASKKYKVRMIGPPPIDDSAQNVRIQALDAAFHLLCDELSIPYLSIFEDLLAEPIWLKEVSSNDGAHPRAGGYSYLAQLVKSWEKWVF